MTKVDIYNHTQKKKSRQKLMKKFMHMSATFNYCTWIHTKDENGMTFQHKISILSTCMMKAL